MKDKPEVSTSLPLAVKRASSALQIGGQIGFWVQLVLGVVSAITLMVTSVNLVRNENSTNTAVGLFFAFTGLIALAVGIYFSYRYTQISRRLATAEPANRPKRATILRQLRIGLIINLAGLLLTLLGAEAITGIVLVKSLQQAPLATQAKTFVNAIDILSVQANIHVIFAHSAGTVTTIWLQDRLNQQ